MLILTRKNGENIFIGDEVQVIVLDARRDRVKLAFSAPSDVPIRRGEIYEMSGSRPASLAPQR